MSMSYFPQVTITFEAALRDLNSAKEKPRAEAAHALRYLDDPAERTKATDALIAVLDDPSPLVRSEAAMSLGDLGGEAAVTPLVACIDDASNLVREAATLSLGKLGFDSAFEPVVAALKHEHADVRFQAANALVEFGAERALAPLLAGLADEDAEVVSAVALALGSLGDEGAIEPLAAALDHPEGQTRFDVAYALTELGDDRGYEPLVARLAEDDLAWDAIDSLERIGEERAADPLGKLINRKTAPVHVQLRAAGALLVLARGHEQAPRAKEILLEGLKLRKIEQRGVAADQLQRVGGKWAIEPLREAKKRRGSDVLDIDGAIAAINERSALDNAQ